MFLCAFNKSLATASSARGRAGSSAFPAFLSAQPHIFVPRHDLRRKIAPKCSFQQPPSGLQCCVTYRRDPEASRVVFFLPAILRRFVWLGVSLRSRDAGGFFHYLGHLAESTSSF